MKVSITEGDFGGELLLRLKELEQRTGIELKRSEKILLAEIGTVEQALSILLDSPIAVSVRKQVAKDDAIEREVILSRQGSDAPLIRAVTTISKQGLPSGVIADILSRKLGIGTIISKHGLETFRRIIEVGYDSNSRVLYRVYEIVHNGETKFRIREEFSREQLPQW